jgi:hypothetical protein
MLQVRVPQGELMLLFIPQIRNPGGGASLELSHAHLRQILQVMGRGDMVSVQFSHTRLRERG